MTSTQIGGRISQDEYVRERMEPRPGDPFYLPLADLRLAMDRVATPKAVRLLDFGCGGSPYRSLFPNAEYLRADIAGTPNLDFTIPSEGEEPRLPVPAASLDYVLSSQVLEHVPSPAAYLREARRMLRPGGVLALTTHGVYQDHGCPHDYYRWTDGGLRRDLTAAGFEVGELWKTTTGPRAVVFLLEEFSPLISKRRSAGLFLWALAALLRARKKYWHRQWDAIFGSYRLVTDGLESHSFYVGLGCQARAA